MAKLLTLQELSAKLGNRSRSAIYNDLAANRLPQPIKLGGRLYWQESALEAHLQEMHSSTQRPEPPQQAQIVSGAALLTSNARAAMKERQMIVEYLRSLGPKRRCPDTDLADAILAGYHSLAPLQPAAPRPDTPAAVAR